MPNSDTPNALCHLWDGLDCGLSIRGDDAEKFLQGLLSCDINLCTPQHAIPGALLDISGRVLSNFALIRHADDDWTMLTPPNMAAVLLADLSKPGALYRQLQLSALEASRLSLIDSQSDDLPEWAVPWSDLQPWGIAERDGVWQMRWGAAPVVECLKLSDAQIAAVDSVPRGQSIDWLARMARHGEPCTSTPTSAKLTAHAMNLLSSDAVSLTKGCYRGQEIVARTEYRGQSKRVLRVLHSDQLPPAESAQINDSSGKRVGAVLQVLSEGIVLGLMAVECTDRLDIDGTEAQILH